MRRIAARDQRSMVLKRIYFALHGMNKSRIGSGESHMSIIYSSHDATIDRLKALLRSDGYSSGIQQRYPTAARSFLCYLASQSLSIENAQLSDVEGFLRREERNYRIRYGRRPHNISEWRSARVAPSRILLRLMSSHVSRETRPVIPEEEVVNRLVGSYDNWMSDLRGLAETTRRHRVANAKQFLTALARDPDALMLKNLQTCHIDGYLRSRGVGLGRSTIKTIGSNLRLFLRYLHGVGATVRDLSSSVSSPKMYTYEGIPSALRAEDVATVLIVARDNVTTSGLRNYAILQLLASYGLRAGEITALRLEDIDWQKNIIRIRQSKTGSYSILPLLREPGEALLVYLESARPRTVLREVFLRLNAPHRALKEGSSLYGVAHNGLTAAGISVSGKKGPHSFRHALAVSLLRAQVPIKAIGDILGHRSAVSTGIYLKLATEDLRAVALDVPVRVSL